MSSIKQDNYPTAKELPAQGQTKKVKKSKKNKKTEDHGGTTPEQSLSSREGSPQPVKQSFMKERYPTGTVLVKVEAPGWTITRRLTEVTFETEDNTYVFNHLARQWCNRSKRVKCAEGMGLTQLVFTDDSKPSHACIFGIRQNGNRDDCPFCSWIPSTAVKCLGYFKYLSVPNRLQSYEQIYMVESQQMKPSVIKTAFDNSIPARKSIVGGIVQVTASPKVNMEMTKVLIRMEHELNTPNFNCPGHELEEPFVAAVVSDVKRVHPNGLLVMDMIEIEGKAYPAEYEVGKSKKATYYNTIYDTVQDWKEFKVSALLLEKTPKIFKIPLAEALNVLFSAKIKRDKNGLYNLRKRNNVKCTQNLYKGDVSKIFDFYINRHHKNNDHHPEFWPENMSFEATAHCVLDVYNCSLLQSDEQDLRLRPQAALAMMKEWVMPSGILNDKFKKLCPSGVIWAACALERMGVFLPQHWIRPNWRALSIDQALYKKMVEVLQNPRQFPELCKEELIKNLLFETNIHSASVSSAVKTVVGLDVKHDADKFDSVSIIALALRFAKHEGEPFPQLAHSEEEPLQVPETEVIADVVVELPEDDTIETPQAILAYGVPYYGYDMPYLDYRIRTNPYKGLFSVHPSDLSLVSEIDELPWEMRKWSRGTTNIQNLETFDYERAWYYLQRPWSVREWKDTRDYQWDPPATCICFLRDLCRNEFTRFNWCNRFYPNHGLDHNLFEKNHFMDYIKGTINTGHLRRIINIAFAKCHASVHDPQIWKQNLEKLPADHNLSYATYCLQGDTCIGTCRMDEFAPILTSYDGAIMNARVSMDYVRVYGFASAFGWPEPHQKAFPFSPVVSLYNPHRLYCGRVVEENGQYEGYDIVERNISDELLYTKHNVTDITLDPVLIDGEEIMDPYAEYEEQNDHDEITNWLQFEYPELAADEELKSESSFQTADNEENASACCADVCEASCSQKAEQQEPSNSTKTATGLSVTINDAGVNIDVSPEIVQEVKQKVSDVLEDQVAPGLISKIIAMIEQHITSAWNTIVEHIPVLGSVSRQDLGSIISVVALIILIQKTEGALKYACMAAIIAVLGINDKVIDCIKQGFSKITNWWGTEDDDDVKPSQEPKPETASMGEFFSGMYEKIVDLFHKIMNKGIAFLSSKSKTMIAVIIVALVSGGAYLFTKEKVTNMGKSFIDSLKNFNIVTQACKGSSYIFHQLTSIFKWVINCARDIFDCPPILDGQQKMSALINFVHYYEGRSHEILRDPKLREDLDQHFENGNAFIASAKMREITPVVADRIARLSKLRNKVQASMKAGKMRKPPMFVKIHGPSGCNKSAITSRLIEVWSDVAKVKDPTRYTMNTKTEFVTGYQQQDVIIIDDLDAKKEDPNQARIIDICSGLATYAVSADVNTMDTMLWNSKLLIATTNVIGRENVNQDMRCPNAVLRRVNFLVTVEPKPEYYQDGRLTSEIDNLEDPLLACTYTVKDPVSEDIVSVKLPGAREPLVCTQITWSQLVAVYKCYVSKFHKEQESIVHQHEGREDFKEYLKRVLTRLPGHWDEDFTREVVEACFHFLDDKEEKIDVEFNAVIDEDMLKAVPKDSPEPLSLGTGTKLATPNTYKVNGKTYVAVRLSQGFRSVPVDSDSQPMIPITLKIKKDGKEYKKDAGYLHDEFLNHLVPLHKDIDKFSAGKDLFSSDIENCEWVLLLKEAVIPDHLTVDCRFWCTLGKTRQIEIFKKWREIRRVKKERTAWKLYNKAKKAITESVRWVWNAMPKFMRKLLCASALYLGIRVAAWALADLFDLHKPLEKIKKFEVLVADCVYCSTRAVRQKLMPTPASRILVNTNPPAARQQVVTLPQSVTTVLETEPKMAAALLPGMFSADDYKTFPNKTRWTNLKHVTVETDVGRYNAYACGVTGNLFMTNSHVLKSLPCVMTCTNLNEAKHPILTQRVESSQVMKLPGRDISFFVSTALPSAKQSEDAFISAKRYPYISENVIVHTKAEGEHKVIPGIVIEKNAQTMSWANQEIMDCGLMVIEADLQVGHSGSIVQSNDPEGKFLGMVQSVLKTGSTTKVWVTIITSDLIKEVISKMEDRERGIVSVPLIKTEDDPILATLEETDETIEGITVLGKVPKHMVVPFPGKTKFRKTYMAAEIFGESGKLPARLEISAMQKHIKSFGGDEMKEMEKDHLEASIVYVGEYLQSVLKIHQPDMTVEESIFGRRIEEDLAPGHKHLCDSTSPGMPYRMGSMTHEDLAVGNVFPTRPGKKDLFRIEEGYINPLFKERVEETYSKMANNIAPNSLSYNFPKDEMRPIEKVIDPKTRVITVVPAHELVINKMVNGEFEAALHLAPLKDVDFFSKVGVDPHSLVWHNMYQKLQKTSLVAIDWDISGYDAHIIYQLMLAVSTVITIACGQSLEGHQRKVRDTLFFSIAKAVVLHGDIIYSKHRGLTSGAGPTTTLDTVAHVVLIYYSWRKTATRKSLHFLLSFESFLVYTTLFVYNDDIVFSISALIEEITYDDIREGIEGLGFTLTDGKKSGVPEAKPITEVTFLKRTFVAQEGVPIVLGALDKETIKDMIIWVRENNEKTQLQENYYTALELASIWGKEYFDDFQDKIGLLCQHNRHLRKIHLNFLDQKAIINSRLN